VFLSEGCGPFAFASRRGMIRAALVQRDAGDMGAQVVLRFGAVLRVVVV